MYVTCECVYVIRYYLSYTYKYRIYLAIRHKTLYVTYKWKYSVLLHI